MILWTIIILLVETRIVCNPRGYFPYQLNPDFDAGKVIEI